MVPIGAPKAPTEGTFGSLLAMEPDLHLGNDEPSEVAVTRLPDGRALLLPRSLRKHTGDTLEVVADLQHQVAEIDEGMQRVTQLVHELRDLGVSWDGIGWCVGTTGRAASMRWGGSDEA